MHKLLIASLLWPTWLAAHSGETHNTTKPTDPPSKLQIGLMFSASAYSSTPKDANGLWRIPGLLMGGDATSHTTGAQIDDALLWGRYQWQPNSVVHAAIGTHSGHSELTLESLYLDYQAESLPQVSLAAGLMDAEFSANASSHASGRGFAETNLLADAFWGRSIHDLALRAEWQAHPQVKLGIELHDGDFFPASKGEGAQVLFAQTEQQFQALNLKAGLWALKAQAVQRGDERYQVGHSHSSSRFNPPDVRFTGKSELAGAWLASSLPLSNLLKAEFDYELVQAKAEGELSETNYRAAYQAEHLGYTLTPSLQYGAWNLGYRFEKLSLDNRLSGAGASVLAQDANLLNDAQPQRQTVQLAWQANKNLRWRAAYTQDETLAKADERFSVGLVWQQLLHKH